MTNEIFLTKAEQLKPVLHHQAVLLAGNETPMKDGGECIFDFGRHCVGYLDIEFGTEGRHPDAPLLFSIQFAEIREELDYDPEEYHGWISRSWVQSETIHIDDLPCTCRLERRYAFRYVRIRILSVSNNYAVTIRSLKADTVSSADDSQLMPASLNEKDRKLDEVSVRTLHECMQEVFEDGPKRDRRLWLGDLRLEALTDYVTYRNYDLVKRCLYLFAGSTLEGGRLSNNIFLYPQPKCDDQTMFDYTLFFINTLWDYYCASRDEETLRELEPVCTRQALLLKTCFDENHLLDTEKAGNVFIDWNLRLDKQAAGQGVYIYGLSDLVKIRRQLGLPAEEFEREIQLKKQAVLRLYDESKGVFVSGPSRQVSYMSQIWIILAGAVSPRLGASVLEHIEKMPEAEGMVSPYAVHHYIQALIDTGQKEKAYEKMHAYWDGMIEKGADTFWELYDPKDPLASPYGGLIVHSFCHAWSCTPSYFLRTYFRNRES